MIIDHEKNNYNNNNNDNDGKRKWQQPFDVHNRGKRGEDVDDIDDKRKRWPKECGHKLFYMF